MSHPTWVRGLKRRITTKKTTNNMSHPTWVRGLKQINSRIVTRSRPSHPTWVRGLKRRYDALHDGGYGVAPYVGAWIETRIRNVGF